MSKITIAKSTFLAAILVTILAASATSIGVTTVSLNSQNFQGPQGETGETGEQGSKGDKGDTGEPGPQGQKGDTGATGAAGATGPTGANGATWYNGSGTPSTSLGVNGDFYLNLANSDVYSKISGTWTKVTNIEGMTGAAGLNGATWFSGETVPSSSLGVNGDFYFNTATNDVYNKVLGGWLKIANIQGATGAQGPYQPDYDSGWINIGDKAGQWITLNHNLNSSNTLVDIVGKASENGDIHQKYLGLTYLNIPSWNVNYGEPPNRQSGQSVVQTSDRGIAVAGITTTGQPGGYDVYLFKTDSNGSLLWQKSFGSSSYDEMGWSLTQTKDGGFAVAGFRLQNGAYVIYMVKTDGDGNLQWQKTFSNGNYGCGARSIIQTDDDGYAIGGWAGSNFTSAFLLKLDSGGNKQWQSTYLGLNEDYCYSVIQCNDGGYALAGYTVGSGIDVFLMKTASDGTQQWYKTYGGPYSDFAYSAVKTDDGGYAIAGSYGFSYSNSAMYLLKTDSNGNQLWSRTYLAGIGRTLTSTVDGGFVVAGAISNGEEARMVKTDKTGIQQWQRIYSGGGCESVVQAYDGRIVLIGRASADIGRVFMVKTDIQGEFGIVRESSTPNSILLYRGKDDLYWNYIQVRIWQIK